MKQQTVVDWFIEKLKNEEGIDFIPTTLIQRAKQMFEEQMKKSWNEGIFNNDIDGKTFSQYYKETYNTEK